MNQTFAIITNDACALSKALREEYGVDEVFIGNIDYPDGRSEKADLDWERITPEEYFGGMADKKHIYKTSCANIDEIYTAMANQAKLGKDVLCIVLSGGLSGSVHISTGSRYCRNHPSYTKSIVY